MAEGVGRIADAAAVLAADVRRRREAEVEAERERLAATRPPSTLSGVAFIAAIPGYAAQWTKVVPQEYWRRDGADAVVSCVCGAEARAVPHIPCECSCDRFFLWTGQTVRVAQYPGWRDLPDD
jgi:hypothetical protein